MFSLQPAHRPRDPARPLLVQVQRERPTLPGSHVRRHQGRGGQQCVHLEGIPYNQRTQGGRVERHHPVLPAAVGCCVHHQEEFLVLLTEYGESLPAKNLGPRRPRPR